jgi:hypothetical protein
MTHKVDSYRFVDFMTRKVVEGWIEREEAETQGEPIIQPDAVADDLTREPVPVMAFCIRFHRGSLGSPGSS